MYSYQMPRRPASSSDVEAGRRLAAVLSEQRQQWGRSAEDLARRAELSVETVRKIERGLVSNPGFFTVAALARHLDLRLDDLAEQATAQETTS